MTVDKIIISYRIIKALGLDEGDETCACQGCKFRKENRHAEGGRLGERGGDRSNKQMRERLYVLQSRSKVKDDLFETGFEISFE